MKTYTTGTRCFIDFAFGGKPKAIVEAIKSPGDGKGQVAGEIQVRLTETVGAYRKGEILTLPAWQVVPIAQKLPLRPGQYFTRVSTRYCYTLDARE